MYENYTLRSMASNPYPRRTLYHRLLNYRESNKLFFRIETDSGITGFGCSAFDEEVTGETEHTIKKALNDIAIPMLLGENPLAYHDILNRMRNEMLQSPTAMASVDMALYDILGKKHNSPFINFLGEEGIVLKVASPLEFAL